MKLYILKELNYLIMLDYGSCNVDPVWKCCSQ